MRMFMVLGFCCVLVGLSAADDKKADAKNADPTGVWKWRTGGGGEKQVFTLSLKLDGDKLTGELSSSGERRVTIQDGTFKKDELNFTASRSGDGGVKEVARYSGKLEGDTLKLTISGRGEKPQEVEAKREATEKPKDK